MNEPLKLTQYDQLENLYKRINNSNTLKLSYNIKYCYFSQDWEIIQFICSWAKQHDSCNLQLFDQSIISNIGERNNMFLIASYITQKVKVGNKNVKNELLLMFKKYVYQMNDDLQKFIMKSRGKQLTFLFLGGARNEFLHHFYDRDKQFKSQSCVKGVINDVLTNLGLSNHLKSSIEKKKDKVKRLKDIIECIYEFFSNTDKHGRTDTHHEEIKQSIRSLSFHIINLSKIDKEILLKKSERYRDFLTKYSEILAVSIFDNGVGIIKRYYELTTSGIETDLSFEQKKEILSEVFKKGTSSSIIPNSGIGLNFAQESIKESNGAYLINTNSIELFYSPDKEGKYEEEQTEITSREGTLITLFIPLREIRK